MKVICENKQARFEYFIEDGFEAGISLDGGEVKSVRRGNVSLKDAYCSVYKGSVIVKNMHIALYKEASAYNVKDDKRDRRLLLHRAEIKKISSKGFISESRAARIKSKEAFPSSPMGRSHILFPLRP